MFIFSGRRINYFDLRWGAHAYVVDKDCADFLIKRLEAQRILNFDPVDLAFRKISNKDSKLIFARSVGSLIDQNTGYPSDLQIRHTK